MNSLRVFRYAFIVGRQEFGGFWSWYTWLGGWLPRVVAQAAFFALLGELLDAPDRLRFLVIGNAILTGCITTLLTVPASTWDRGDGTYPLLVASPSSLLPAIMGRTYVWPMNGVVTSVVALLIVAAIFGIELPWPATLLVVPLVILTITSVYSFSLFLGCLVTRLPRARNVVHNVAAILLMAFAGVSVPVAFWPEWVEVIAQILPLTHGLEAIRLVLNEASAGAVLENAALELLVSSAWLAASLLLIDRFADAGRRDASIDFV